MDTKEAIIQLGDALIRDKGFNAFSFYDISRALGIKNASIHYHFPTKTDLALSVIAAHKLHLEQLMEKVRDRDPITRLKTFLSIYVYTKAENKVCIVGSLATDLHTIDNAIEKQLRLLAERIVSWVVEILEEGRATKVFSFNVPARTKALLIITNMLGALQISRLTSEKDFNAIRESVIKDLKT